MNLKNVKSVAEKYNKKIVERAQLELGTRRTQVAGSGNTYTGRKVASDNLRKSLTGVITQKGDNFSFSFGAKGTAKKYAGFVHDGRKAGKMPPLKDILEYVRKKRLRPRDPETNAFISPTPSRMRGLAFVMARAIGEHGTKEFPYYTMAVDHYRNKMGAEILDAYLADVNDFFNGDNDN